MNNDNSFSTKILWESLYHDCCIIEKRYELYPGAAPFSGKILRLVVGPWAHYISETFLIEATADYRYINLIIDRVMVFESEFYSMLSNIIGSKVISLSILDCSHLSWKSHIRPLLNEFTNIEAVHIIRNEWMDDFVIEQLCLKFSKTLKVLEFEKARLSDTGIQHVARKCLGLRAMFLVFCPRCGDAGLVEMCKKIRLSYLQIAHNLKITDKAIESIFSSSSTMTNLVLINCPNLSDKCMSSLYESQALWGKKRNVQTSTLNSFVIRDNPKFTYHTITFLTTAVPELKILDIRECSNINLNRCLPEMEGMNHLDELYLGPCDSPLDPEIFIESLLFHANRLRKIYLNGFLDVPDQILGEFIAGTLLLDDIVLIDMNVGHETIEAICSHIPNINALHIEGSILFDDADLRCLATVCLRLTQLRIHRCPQITDAGFTRCVTLTRLNSLEVCQISPLSQGIFLSSLTLCPLECLRIDDLHFQSNILYESLLRMNPISKSRLKEIRLLQCRGLNGSHIKFFLNECLHLQILELTGSEIDVSDLMSLSHFNPFLTLDSRSEFMGYSLKNPQDRINYFQYWTKLNRITRHLASTLMRRLRLKYKEYLKQERQRQREAWLVKKAQAALKLQSMFRQWLCQLRFKPQLQAGRRIVRAARRYLLFRYYGRLRFAKLFYQLKIQRNLFHILLVQREISIPKLLKSSQAVVRKVSLRAQRRLWGHWHSEYRSSREDKFVRSAQVFRDNFLMKQTYSRWKSLIKLDRIFPRRIKEPFQRQKEFFNYSLLYPPRISPVVHIFLQCCSLSSWNSTCQRNLVKRAESFSKKRLMILSWICFSDEYLRALRAEKLMPKAIEFFNGTFFQRVVRATFASLFTYLQWKRHKRISKQRAERWRIGWVSRQSQVLWKLYLLRRNFLRFSFNQGVLQWDWYWKHEAVTIKWPFITGLSKWFKYLRDHAIEHLHHRWKVEAKKAWIAYVIRRKEWKALNRRANEFKLVLYGKHTWKQWHEYLEFMKNKHRYVYRRYLLSVAKKMIRILDEYRLIQKKYVEELKERLDRIEREKEEKRLRKLQEEQEEMERLHPELKHEREMKMRLEMKEKEDREMELTSATATEPGDVEENATDNKFTNGDSGISEDEAFAASLDPNHKGISPYEKFLRSLTRFQACIRRRQMYRKFQSHKITALFAIQTLQNFIRRGLALRKYKDLKKKWKLRESIREDLERSAMRESERESSYYEFLVHRIVDIQRAYRGWKGRMHFIEVAYKVSREKSIEYYSKIAWHRNQVENFRRQALAREMHRNKMATQIQKIVRGRLGRLRVVQIRRELKKMTAVVKIQTAYRSRWSKIQLFRKIRTQAGRLRFFAARNQRAMLYRMIGLRKRRMQKVMTSVLENLGLNPLSFNYRYKELYDETVEDFWKLKAILEREYQYIKDKMFFNFAELAKSRRKYLEDNGQQIARFNPVRILERGHNYRGFTGTVTRIDEDIRGLPLFEVRLDQPPRLDKMGRVLGTGGNKEEEETKALGEEEDKDAKSQIHGSGNNVKDGKAAPDANRANPTQNAIDTKQKKKMPRLLMPPSSGQTYVRMTTDTLARYENLTEMGSLCPTTAHPDLGEITMPFQVYGLDPENPFYRRKNVIAAWTIQMAFRRYRARKKMNRKRFEYWRRCRARQAHFFYQLSQSGCFTTQASNASQILGFRPPFPVKFNEIRHLAVPQRFRSSVAKVSEDVTIQQEIQAKYRQRIQFLTKAALKRRTDYFADGYERLSGWKKFSVLSSLVFGMKSSSLLPRSSTVNETTSANAIVPKKSFLERLRLPFFQSTGNSRAVGSQPDSAVTISSKRPPVTGGRVLGVDTYRFAQFQGSPHVRYSKTSLYQGPWTGVPLLTPLHPQGLGLVIFLDAWGYSREDKVLYLTLVRARYLLAADLGSSDPYVTILCNGTQLQSQVHYDTLHPEFHESFEIDVTNPQAKLSLVVKDKDYFGSDDVLGKIDLFLADFDDGMEHSLTLLLKSEDDHNPVYRPNAGPKDNNAVDLGELDIRLKWTNRKFEDDLARIELERAMAVRLQCWARRLAGKNKRAFLAKERKALLEWVRKASVRITCLIRKRLANKELKKRRRQRKSAIKIQCRIRIFLAKAELARLRVQYAKVVIIQCCMRQKLARMLKEKMVQARKIKMQNAATRIQSQIRCMLALKNVHSILMERAQQLKEQKLQERRGSTMSAQSGGLEISLEGDMDDISVGSFGTQQEGGSLASPGSPTASIALTNAEGTDTGSQGGAPPPVIVKKKKKRTWLLRPFLTRIRKAGFQDSSQWIKTYGVDPEYGLRRNRRIVERGINKILTMRFFPIVSRPFGIVYLSSYPPKMTDEDMMAEAQAANETATTGKKNKITMKPKGPLRDRLAFMEVYFPLFRPMVTHKTQVIDFFESFNGLAVGFLHIASSVDLRGSVVRAVTVLQCRWRQAMAQKAYFVMKRVSWAIGKFQRIFRKRYEVFHKKAFKIQALFRCIVASKIVNAKRKEHLSAIRIQCAYRVYLAQRLVFNWRCVENLVALKSTPECLEAHPAEKALEHREETFWMAKSKHSCEIRVEFSQVECITDIWIMTSMFSASPQFVTIHVIPAYERNPIYECIVNHAFLPRLKGPRWHRFPLKQVQAKYFKLEFFENYGDDEYIAVRQIRFLKSKEKSATIIQEPITSILKEGPTVGTHQSLTLTCIGEGWPLPSYQWYRNDVLIPGATSPTLSLDLYCPLSSITRNYRCLRCKMISKAVPWNAFHAQCANCSYLSAFKEIEAYDNAITAIETEEKKRMEEQAELIQTRLQMENVKDPKFQELYADLMVKIQSNSERIQALHESRIQLKGTLGDSVNRFTDEGVYCCEVRNYRGGGSICLTRKSHRAVVVVQYSIPFEIEVLPQYQARQQTIRKNWTIYSSLWGHFRKGRLDGTPLPLSLRQKMIQDASSANNKLDRIGVPLKTRMKSGPSPSQSIVVIHYFDGAVYEGPYVSEEWLDDMGKVRIEGRHPNHYGVFRCADGRIFEGDLVDNHFDPKNLQSFYRLTLPNGEVYEGNFTDEQFHGVGMYTFTDGSIYEGHWHRGFRFGHGHFRSSEGWTYEGRFDSNRRHGKGVQTWPDGSMYLGQWYFDTMKGNGIFITPLRDIYRGQIVDGLFQGFGELLYADGSIYKGDFLAGQRHGRGIFTDKTGNAFYGHFVEDMMHGEVIVKFIIPVLEMGQANFEVRVGIYEHGDLLKWKQKFANQVSTKQFIKLFREDPAMFDSVYSMILAKNLPGLPEGIDPYNPDVQAILVRIRNEAGMLVGFAAITQANQRIASLLSPIQEKKNAIESVKKQQEDISMKLINLDQEMQSIHRKFSNLFEVSERELQRVEQYWVDDPRQVRLQFQQVIQQLRTLEADEFFKFKNYRIPPPFVKKIMNGLSFLLGTSLHWDDQRKLMSDSVYNARQQEEDALRFEYDCQLVFWMFHPQTPYSVYAHTQHYLEHREDLNKLLADPRMRRDSYYIESCGARVGPLLIDWIRTNREYVKAAINVRVLMEKAEEKKTEAFRLKAVHHKKKEEYNNLLVQSEALRVQLDLFSRELLELQDHLVHAKDMLKFLEDALEFSRQKDRQRDYYQQLEEKLERDKERFELQTSLQFIIQGVEQRMDDEKRQARREALARGEKYVEKTRFDEDDYEEDDDLYFKNLSDFKTVGEASIEDDLRTMDSLSLSSLSPEKKVVKIHTHAPSIRKWLEREVKQQQAAIQAKGFLLGYSFQPPEDPSMVLTAERTRALVLLCAELVLGKLNDGLSEPSYAKEWYSLRGKRFTARFLYIFAWKFWEELGIEKRDIEACQAWESIFETVELCADRAVEARVNPRMSAVARRQAQVWAQRHPKEIKVAEEAMAAVFVEAYPEQTGDYALEISEEASLNGFHESSIDNAASIVVGGSSLDPLTVAQCRCWIKYHAMEFTRACDDRNQKLSEQFQQEFPENPGETCFYILNGIANESDSLWWDYANHWRSFHMEDYEKISKSMIDSLAQDFLESHKDLCPSNTSATDNGKGGSGGAPLWLASAKAIDTITNDSAPFHHALAREAARLIENQALLTHYPTGQSPTEPPASPTVVFQATCYGVRHQGLLRQAKQLLWKEWQQVAGRQWQEIQHVTEDWTKGSSLYLTDAMREDPSLDRFSGFRQRLEGKYAWLRGFIGRKYEKLSQELSDWIQSQDPTQQVSHRIRPSEYEDWVQNREKQFVERKKSLEDELADTIKMLTQWNSYFGSAMMDIA